MKRKNLTIHPAEWLRGPPAGLSPDRVADVLETFAKPPFVSLFTGPGELLRATGVTGSGERARAYGGSFWCDTMVFASIDAKLGQYTGWLNEKELQLRGRDLYRAGAAICDDWNDLSEFHKMVVPSGESFEGLCGETRSQPKVSSLNRNEETTPMLSGGFEQIYLKVRNPFWIYPAAPL